MSAEGESNGSAAISGAVWHSLVWLVIGNAIGVMISILLLWPGINPWLGEWTYGRWMIVHMNVLLYGWCSLPMIGFLFKAYGANRRSTANWCRPVLWLWSGALVAGSLSWLSGESSGKLFLDWSGFARVLFPLAMGSLWILLAFTLIRGRAEGAGIKKRLALIAGLAILAAVPFTIYLASSPNVYPAVNPDSGGPTGASQLESSLSIVFIVLVIPFGVTRRTKRRTRAVTLSWIVFFAESALCLVLGRSDISHHRPGQFLSLASLLLWIVLIPVYYAAFHWVPESRPWRTAMCWWWGGLVVSGWVLFLPGILDRIKFTDVLVGHSLTAVAGFLTALLILIMMQLIGANDSRIFSRRWSFHAWNLGVLAYVVIISIAGWIEGTDPAFTIVPGPVRDVLYFVRLLTGIAMLAGSLEWMIAASSLPSLAPATKAEMSGVHVA
jgi:cytochrome c oxidase cbb3-type subunit 1